MMCGYIVAPIVTCRMVRMPPALIVLAMAVIGTLYRFFGILIATPLTAVMTALIRETYIRDILGDQ